MSVDKGKYVVLDLETNGLRTSDDILSISLYKPDDGRCYNRFLPLECAKELKSEAVAVNGITKKDLEEAEALSQRDVDALIAEFELDRRLILTYSSFDQRMLSHYFARKGLYGFDRLKFYNFKQDVISSKYSEGNITKDNLCAVYGIENVRSVHSSMNDCILEWRLFERMDGNKLFITDNKVFEMSQDYIIPVSFFASHPKLERFVPGFPDVRIETHLLKRFEISGKGISRFETNINGMLIEHLINRMLDAQKQDSRAFLLMNKSKLRYLGTLPTKMYDIPLVFREDGLVAAINPEDKAREKEFNQSLSSLKSRLENVVSFIAQEVFQGERIRSQELVIHKEDRILALCDLSTDWAVLEIKTNYKADPYAYRNQLYYESNGRRCYLLQIDWSGMPDIFAIEILEAELTRNQPHERRGPMPSTRETVQKKITNENIEVVHYVSQKEKVMLRCRVCKHEWQTTYRTAIGKPQCPVCESPVRRLRKEKMTEDERKRKHASSYVVKLKNRSNGCLHATGYVGSKDYLTALCLKCGYQWKIRADHLLDRPYCVHCKANKKT